MVLQSQEMLVQAVLTDTIRAVCRKTVPYNDEFVMEGKLRITADQKEVFIIIIDETVNQKPLVSNKKSPVPGRKRGRPPSGRKRGRPPKVKPVIESDGEVEMVPDFPGMDEDTDEEYMPPGGQKESEQSLADMSVKDEPEYLTSFEEPGSTDETALQKLAATLADGAGFAESDIAEERVRNIYCRVSFCFLPLNPLGPWGIVIITVCLSVHPSIHAFSQRIISLMHR